MQFIELKTPHIKAELLCLQVKKKLIYQLSKKTHKRAVKRNRLKRLMRESYRLLLKSGDLGNSQNYMSLIFIGSQNALDKNFAQIQNIINTLIKRL